MDAYKKIMIRLERMEKMKKTKVAMITNHFEITGISTVILNYCKVLDKKKYDLTVIAGQPIADENRKECAENGINIIELSSRHKKTVKHYYALWKVLKKNCYDIVHVHGSSSMMAIELSIAKIAGRKIRIAHSHNSMCPNMKVHRILNPYFKKTYTKALACGKLAGDWLFGENEFEILPNGFQTELFEFDEAARKRVRRELEIDDKFVVGHIGRFNDQKNQEYLIEAFEKFAEVHSDAVLLLIGTGPDYDKAKERADNSLYRKQIILYGVTKETRAMYAAMDVFVLPSKYEGLPVVLLEAQISGLPCIVSDRVTEEVDFGEIRWESIDSGTDKWAAALADAKVRTIDERKQYWRMHKHQINRYDIELTVEQMEDIYDQLVS